MNDLSFLGVYATNEMPVVLGAALRPMVKRKRLWFAWKAADDKYQVQALNAIMQPMSEPRLVDAEEFHLRYTHEPGETATPQEDAPGNGEEAVQEVLASAPFALRADDPNLLRSWLTKSVPAPALENDEFSPIQEVQLARLVEESMPGRILDMTLGAGEEDAGEGVLPVGTEQALRADFAMALLKIKQGRRQEGLALLDNIMRWQGAPFAGAAELFSEFGLNLRRLGITSLALFAHRRALALAPEDERVHFNLARVYHDLKKYDIAREHLEKALELAPDFATARQFLFFLNVPGSGATVNKERE